jgi:hypothetical protein
MKKLFWILLAIAAIIWSADLLTGIEHSLTWNTKIWYFAGAIIYIIGGGGITFEANDENIKGPVRYWLNGLWFINIAFIFISIAGLIINFFFTLFHWFGFFALLPLSIQTILGWPSIITVIILIILTIGFSCIKEDILPIEDRQ